MMGLQTSGRIDDDSMDFLGAVMRHVFDVHAAFGRRYNRDTAGCPVNEQSEVEFLLNIGAIGDVETVDLLTFGASLDRHQRVAQHIFGMGLNLIQIEGQTHAAFCIGSQFLELALAASTSMDLRFNHVKRAGKLLRGGNRLFHA